MPRLTRRALTVSAVVAALAMPQRSPANETAPPPTEAPATPPVAAPAIDPDIVNVRSMRQEVDPRIASYIGLKAEGQKLTPQAHPDAEERTADQYGSDFCGIVSEGWRKAFLTLNGEKADSFSFTSPLKQVSPRKSVYDLTFPACLKVSTAVGEHEVRKGDTAAWLYSELTGSAGGPDTRAAFFGVTDLHPLKLGRKLNYRWLSTTTPLRPRSDLPDFDREAFVDGLRAVVRQVAGEQEVSKAFVRIDRELLGDRGDATPRVVTAADVQPDGSVVPPAECAGMAPRLSPFRVHEAFRVAHDGPAQDVRVLVVDNGFYGATFDADTEVLAISPRFAPHVAKTVATGRIGPNVSLDPTETYGPILKPEIIQPSEISGHGTHVAGLVLGGALLSEDRDLLRNGDYPWLKVSIANVGNGEQYLPSRMISLLGEVLKEKPQAQIINMSLVYTKRHKPTFLVLTNENPDRLFVVASGNDHGRSVIDEELFPAALGGHRQNNVITVAAHRGDGRLADFTNVGASAVDIAADGCNVSSWIDFAGEPRPLSGSSQATPLVVLTAALIRAAVGDEATPAAIKNRILISGDLVSGFPGPKPPIYSRSVLNMAKALYVRKDYVRYRDRDGRLVEALGQLTSAEGAGCEDSALDKFSAFKARGTFRVGFSRNDGGVDIPCTAVVKDTDRIWFRLEDDIAPDGKISERPGGAASEPERIFLKKIEEFVRRM